MLHTTVLDSYHNWNDLQASVINAVPSQNAVTQAGPPPGTPVTSHAFKYGYNHAFPAAAADGFNQFQDPQGFGFRAGYYLAVDMINYLDAHPGAIVVYDEIKSPTPVKPEEMGAFYCAWYAAWYIYAHRPNLATRWGMYIPSSRVIAWDTLWYPIYYLLAANAFIGCQAYVTRGAYLNRKDRFGVGVADWWLKGELVGSMPAHESTPNTNAGFSWLYSARTYVGSGSRLAPIATVVNEDLSTLELPAFFMMDRTIWSYKTCGLIYSPHQPYGSETWSPYSGVGSWKWESGFQGTLRDGYFASAWHWYLDAGPNWDTHFSPRYDVT